MESGKELALVVFGAGGHAKAVLDLLAALGRHRVAGVVDDAPRAGSVLGHPVLGGAAVLPALRRQGVALACVAIGNNTVRERLGATLRELGFALPALAHPAALVSPHATLAEGVVVMPRAVIGPDARIGSLALVNTGAIVEHDCTLDVAAHAGPGAVLAGGARLGARALLGAGAVLRPGTMVGADALVAAGSAVAGPVPDGARVGGVPARPLG